MSKHVNTLVKALRAALQCECAAMSQMHCATIACAKCNALRELDAIQALTPAPAGEFHPSNLFKVGAGNMIHEVGGTMVQDVYQDGVLLSRTPFAPAPAGEVVDVPLADIAEVRYWLAKVEGNGPAALDARLHELTQPAICIGVSPCPHMTGTECDCDAPPLTTPQPAQPNPAQCSSLCATGEPCSITETGKCDATEPAPGEGLLQWSKNMSPDESCRYNHCTAETLFGRFLITWKGWKDYDSPTVDETPWGEFDGAFNDVDSAKLWCEEGFAERLSAYAQQHRQAPGEGLPDALKLLEQFDTASARSDMLITSKTAAIRAIEYAQQHRAAVLTQQERPVVEALLDLAYAAWCLADNSEDAGAEGVSVLRADFTKLSERLDALDELPDDQPGYTMAEAAKARWALRRLLDTTAALAGAKP